MDKFKSEGFTCGGIFDETVTVFLLLIKDTL
jgi:hypothetical protein